MRYSIFLLLLLFSMSRSGNAQSGKAPDIPGAFVLQLGINKPASTPDHMPLGFWGSRSFNISYENELRLGGSRFFLVPSVMLAMERLKFKNNEILQYQSGDLILASIDEAVKKSQLVMNYFDVPASIRYCAKPDNRKNSFSVSLGVKGGVLVSSHAKIKYAQGDDIVKEKIKRRWGLNQFRYGVTGAVGLGNVSLFAFYNMVPLFEDKAGPDGNAFNVMTLGLSIGAF
ncbi:MAG TPA: outer membrane beta-barrel protein [Chryseosolibacter sp.]